MAIIAGDIYSFVEKVQAFLANKPEDCTLHLWRSIFRPLWDDGICNIGMLA